MDRTRNNWIGLSLVVAAIFATSTGCAAFRFAGILVHAWQGESVPAQYEGLEGKHVAVVCLSEASMYAGQLSETVANLLAKNVPDIEMVPQREVYAWLDENDWNELDFAQIGKGVGADAVVAIEMDSFRLYDGMTMYHGRADVSLGVYDVAEEGHVVFRTDPFRFSFPSNAPMATTDMSESQFRVMYIKALARRIAKHFYSYNIHEDFAVDNSLVGTGL